MTRRQFRMVAVFSRKQMIWFLLGYMGSLMQEHFRDISRWSLPSDLCSSPRVNSFMTFTNVRFPLIPQTLVLSTASSDSCKEFCPIGRLLTSPSMQCAVCGVRCAVSSGAKLHQANWNSFKKFPSKNRYSITPQTMTFLPPNCSRYYEFFYFSWVHNGFYGI